MGSGRSISLIKSLASTLLSEIDSLPTDNNNVFGNGSFDLYETVRRNHISMCGVLPAVIVLETLQRLGALKRAERVGYATTADTTGDTSRVVGYAGMLFGG